MNAVPATCAPGSATVNESSEPGLTVMPLCVPVIDDVTVSVAVIDCVGVLNRVTPLVNVCTPLSAPEPVVNV